MEGDGSPRKKKSRFFSSGKSLIGNIQASLQNRNANSSNKAVPSMLRSGSSKASAVQGTSLGTATSSNSQETSFENASNTFTSPIPKTTEEQLEDVPDPGKTTQVSTAAKALENFSFNKHAIRRQGIGPDAFKQLTSTGLAPATQTYDNQGSVVSSSTTSLGPKSTASTNLSTIRQPPIAAATTETPTSQYQEEQQLPSQKALPDRSSSAQPLLGPPGALNSHPQLQPQAVLSHQDQDPTKLMHGDANLRQPFLFRPYDKIRADPNRAQRPRLIPNIPNTGISNLPLHATLTPTRRLRADAINRVPPTLYTSPNRIPNALAASRKRKRSGLVLPPPAYIYTRTNSPAFNVFHAILLYPELCFHLSTHLPLNTLISLYAISRDFHTILDTRFTTVILSQSLSKAPDSSRTFPFRCYAHLCRRDPASRIPHPDPIKAAVGASRAVPSFRWLRMVLFREKVVHEIMTLMAEDGVPLPSRCALALKRMWFLLDIPDNARRIGFVHSNTLVADLDLYFLMAFFVKLDMRFNDPVAQTVYHGARKLVLAQRSLSFLLRVLKREELRNQFEVMRAWVRTRYVPAPDEVELSIFGVKAQEVGKTRYEYWGRRPAQELKREVQILLRPEQLVMREAVRRGLRFQKHFLRSLMYGYVRPDTLTNYAPRELGRRIGRLWDEYGVDDEVGGEGVPREERAREPLLDLGERKEISTLCIVEDTSLDEEQVQRKEKDDEFLRLCMKWSRDEREWEEDVEMVEV